MRVVEAVMTRVERFVILLGSEVDLNVASLFNRCTSGQLHESVSHYGGRHLIHIHSALMIPTYPQIQHSATGCSAQVLYSVLLLQTAL